MRKKVLVVEDDNDYLQTVMEILGDKGYNVIIKRDGSSVGSLVKKEKPDIILLDFKLPIRNGDEIALGLKKNKTTKEIPIIMISADTEISVIAKRVGAEEYLEKPFKFSKLLQLIEKFA